MLDQIMNTVFHKAQFWVHYFLILIWLTYFMNVKKKILQTMLTTQLPIHVILTSPLSYLNYWIILTKSFNWLGNNPAKCHLLLSTKSTKVVSIDGIQITSSTAETLLGITIDSELNFENHLSTICNQVSRQINALGRIVNYMSREKGCIMMKTSIESQFNYCPLI